MSRKFDARQAALKAYGPDREAAVQLFLEYLETSAKEFFHEEVMTPEEYLYGPPVSNGQR